MKRIGPGWVLIAGLAALAAGCPEAIYTLGRLPGDGTDASTLDGQIGNDANSGTGGDGGTSGDSGTGGDGGSGGAGGTGMCSVLRATPQRKGQNLYLMVDSSFAIALQPVWPQLQQGVLMFVDDPLVAGIGVGIQFYGLMCDPAAYARPSVAVAPLPGVAESIRSAVQTTVPFMGVAAAIAPAAQGAVTYAASLENDDPDRENAVLFITDSVSDTACGGDIDDATAAVAAAFAGEPAIETYVIAIESGLISIDVAPLDRMAVAGGTVSAHRVPVDLEATENFHAALVEIALSAQPCSFELPDDFEPTRTAIEWQITTAASIEVWPFVNRASACGTSRSIYYDASTGYVQLCPAACSVLRAAPRGVLRMRLECE